MKNLERYAIGLLSLFVIFSGCSSSGGDESDGLTPAITYTVVYNGNGFTGGSVPVDSASYAKGATVTVLGNSGSLIKTGSTFTGWNTAADKSGTAFSPGSTFVMGEANVLLYAVWTAPGSLDTSFLPGTGPNNAIYTFALESNGKILIGGAFSSYNGTSRNRIARLLADGSLDSTFDPGTGAGSAINSVALQSDGKVLIGGTFATFNGTSKPYFARLNADGGLDASFDPGTGPGDRVETVVVAADGKILIGGFFTTYNGTTRNYIARVNSNGSIDTSFSPVSGADSTVDAIALQSDGKILIGGDFLSYDGSSRKHVARLKADGTLDTTFNPGTGTDGEVLSLLLQSDGKVLIGGKFTSYNGTARNYIARLNADGSLDTAFDPGTGASYYVHALALLGDGKILAVGEFTSYNGTARNYIGGINADGTLNAVFDPGTGGNSYVYSLAVQSDGLILIGGAFNTYNGTSKNHIARISP